MTTTTYAADRTALLIVDPSNDGMSAGGTFYEATGETAAAVGFYDTRRTNPWMRAAMARTERIVGMQTLLAYGGQTRSGAHERARRRDVRRRGPTAPSRRAS